MRDPDRGGKSGSTRLNLGLEGRVALVCGSTRGIGRAVATALAAEGAKVAINGRSNAPFTADVSVPDQAIGLVERVAKEFGRLDILFCNAGGPPAAAFKDQPAEAWQRAIELNLLSTIHLARAAVPIMRRAQWGRIICLVSIAAKQPLPGLILSTTARAGVLGFAKALSDEVATDGITVNCINPGFIATERVQELQKAKPDMMKQMLAQIPMGRIGTPADLAAAVTFLASERASYITGAVLQVDGGFTRSIF
ncbi:MAG TPA: SDR family oxidoreductase [Gemmatimonadales bacterium]|nr:SDR family oxidoreductase [Gemmatimonadales bacterium]